MTDVSEPSSRPVPPSERAGADDLRSGLADLAGLVADSLGLEELLARVASYAVQAIPAADGAGLTLLRTDRPDNRVEVLAASAPSYSRSTRSNTSRSTRAPASPRRWSSAPCGPGRWAAKLWPRFGPRVGRLGVHSVLSLPLLLPGRVVGAINVYAHSKDAFTDRAAELGELFAVPAAVAVHNAHVLTQARTLTAQLQTALSTRPVIDQAIGILRARSGGTAEEAFDRLRRISQTENIKLAAVAQSIVKEAVRRAQARHTGR